MNGLQKFMLGRYGFDEFTRLLVLVSLVFSILSIFLRFGLFSWLVYLPFFFAVFRTLSKNIDRRRIELYQYRKYRNLFDYRWKMITGRFKEAKTHRRFRCPKCRQQLRVPKGKGKIEIACPKCKTKFIKRT